MYCVSQIVDIFCGDTDNGDSAIFGKVDAVLFHEFFHLLWFHASEAKHADLIRDV